MKENKIEKLILDLSNRWDCTPQEAVDRLNSMNESEINKLINSMTKKFKNGGFIDCLRAGGTVPQCKKCGGKAPIKADGGDKLPYYMTSKVERVFGGLSQNPKYPRKDDIDGYFSGEILPSGDTLTVVEGPYTKYEEVRPADGKGRFFNVYRKDNSDRFYDPGRKDRGWFRTKASEELVEMFNNIRSRFEGSTDKKKCGGSLPSKKKNYLKK